MRSRLFEHLLDVASLLSDLSDGDLMARHHVISMLSLGESVMSAVDASITAPGDHAL